MDKRIITWVTVMLFVGMLDAVASIPKGIVKSFIADVPDTVIQGVPFIVSYKLTANSWKAGGRPLSGKGFILQAVNYSQKNGNPYSELTAKATYVTSLCGNHELPGMTIIVGDKTVTSTNKTIYVKPNKEYGEEMAYAHDFLLEHGKHCDSLCLSMTERNKHFWVFEDLRNSCFCLVARKDVWPIVGLPVLAYSTESSMGIGHGSYTHKYMSAPYDSQIEALLKSEVNKDTDNLMPYHPQNKVVEPLLGQLMWGQDEPYNRFSPTVDGKETVVGCVPLATVMAAYYHKWPTKGQSHIYYQYDKVYKLEFDSAMPQWSDYKKEYNKNDSLPELDNLSKFMTFVGLAIDAEFKNQATSAYLRSIKPVLCNNLGYSGKIAYYEDGLSEGLIESLLYYELDHKRPCIVSCKGHSFVCDGYKDDFFHYNLGWYGSYNGYYRLKLGNYHLPEGEKNLLLIKEIVIGIEPQKRTLEREVTLNEAGSLDQILTSEEKENLTSLKINGPLNSSDFILLRKMAGALDETSFTGWRGGALRKLDLGDTFIVTDKTPYLTKKATGVWTHWESNGKYSNTVIYNFDMMTEKTWKQFKSDIGTKQDGLIYTRKDDNTYWESFFCQKNIIGKHLFADCSSLQEIVLPQATKKIDNYAFLRCVSLQEIRLPEKVKEVGKTPFFLCTVLEKVLAPKSMTSEGNICEKCSPVLLNIQRY